MAVLRSFSSTMIVFIFLQGSILLSNAETNAFSNKIWDLFNFSQHQASNSAQDLQDTVPLGPGAQVQKVDTSTICIGCASNMYDDHEWEKEITALRIEYIKNQILKKLRLKEKPSISLPISGLPKPVTENENLFPKTQDQSDEYNDDYYGKTTQAIIFPHEDAVKCTKKKRNPSACLPFQIPGDLDPSDVSMAELWVYKKNDTLDNHNQTFLVTEVAHWDSKLSFQKTKPIAMKETHLSEGWVKINVAWAVKNWLDYRESSHVINVACKTCGMDIEASPISAEPSQKPFLVIYTYSQPRRRQQRRIKRNVVCSPGVNVCCKESLYVSFADIGWNDWILHPAGYNAYFCRGSCTAAASVTLSGSYHSTILQKYLYRPSSQKLELVPCCAPTQYQNLELLLLDDNKTLTTKVLPNMIVDTCGCM